MLAAALGMTDDDMAAAGVLQHLRTQIAGMRPARILVAILATEKYAGFRQRVGQAEEQSRRRADQEIARNRFASRSPRGDRAMGELARQGQSICVRAVHLPIAGDEFSSALFHASLLVERSNRPVRIIHHAAIPA